MERREIMTQEVGVIRPDADALCLWLGKTLAAQDVRHRVTHRPREPAWGLLDSFERDRGCN
jgi:hypothetical protein